MNKKTGLKGVAVVLAIAFMSTLGLAQNAGFSVAIAHGQHGVPGVGRVAVPALPQAPPVFVPKSTFIGRPNFLLQPPAIVGIPVVVPVPVIVQVPTLVQVPTYAQVPQIPAVIVPNYVLAPGQTSVQPFAPIGVAPFGAAPFGSVGFVPPTVAAPEFIPPASFGPGPGRHAGPTPGTSRADVLRQYGQPSVTVYTSSGETFYFTGGVTVIIQNGQVAGPR